MKKIITFVLACVMLASVFAVNVFAANIVGDRANGTGVTEDVFAQNPGNAEGNINVTVNAVTHNYAADIEYRNLDVTLPTITWDVQDLMYTTTGGTDFANDDPEFIITNYSDLDLAASIQVDDEIDDDTIGFTWIASNIKATDTVNAPNALVAQTNTVNGDTASAKIAKVTVNDIASAGKAQKVSFILDMECENLVTATEVLFEAQSAAKAIDPNAVLAIASFTVTVSIPAQN